VEAIDPRSRSVCQRRGFPLADTLRVVRDKRLYRQEYLTFEDYCVRKWGWGKSYGYRLIEAAQIKRDVKNLSPTGDKIETDPSEGS